MLDFILTQMALPRFKLDHMQSADTDYIKTLFKIHGVKLQEVLLPESHRNFKAKGEFVESYLLFWVADIQFHGGTFVQSIQAPEKK